MTVYSALDGCMPLRRSSCFLATFSASSGIFALVIFSPNSSRSPPPSSSSPSSSLIALSCWRSTYSRWLRPISSCTCVLMRSRTLSTSSWRDRNWSTLRVRVLRSNVSRTSCFSPTSSSRCDVMRSARWPASVTLSTSAPASFGSSGISLTTRFAMSLRFITSASSSTSDARRIGDAADLRGQERLGAVERRDLEARDALQDDGEVVLRELDDLQDPRGAADHVEVAGAGILGARVLLREDADDRPLLRDRVLDEAHATCGGRRRSE